MNFVERIFGFSPDAGSGLLEWSLLLIAFLVFMVIAVPYFLETLRKQSVLTR
jgi:hypothetical protein